jgi:hypothetical protein
MLKKLTRDSRPATAARAAEHAPGRDGRSLVNTSGVPLTELLAELRRRGFEAFPAGTFAETVGDLEAEATTLREQLDDAEAKVRQGASLGLTLLDRVSRSELESEWLAAVAMADTIDQLERNQ